jgi:histidyl-tRNA synthetase
MAYALTFLTSILQHVLDLLELTQCLGLKCYCWHSICNLIIFDVWQVKLNHRRLLDGMLEICGVPATKFRSICSAIDKLDKLDWKDVKKEMVEEKGLSEETADEIGKLVDMKGEPTAVLEKLEREGSPFLENAGSKSALKELGTLFHYLQNANCLHRISFDLSLARGLDYYTGVIYEAVFKGSTSSSSETGQVTQVACKHLIFFPSFPLQIVILVVSLANCSIT